MVSGHGISLRNTIATVLALGLAHPGASLAADEPAGGLEEVVVTAQRRSEHIEDVPMSITAQSTEDLSRAGISDIRDLGNVVPGLSFTTQGPFAAPTIRGVQSTIAQAGADSPVAIYVDGIYQPNQLANVFDLADIQQVEVLRGPQGTLFGRNATGGAISVRTRKPTYDWTGDVGLEYGLYNGSDQNGNDVVAKGYVSGPIIADTLAFSLSGYYRDLDGYLTNDNNGDQSGKVERYTLRGKLLWEPADNISLTLTALISNRVDLTAGATQALNGNGVAAQYADGVVSTQPWHVASNLYQGSSPVFGHQKAFALAGEFGFDGIGTLTTLTSYTDTQTRYDVDLDTGTSALCKATFTCLDFAENYPNDTFQQELNFSSEKFGAFSFVGGLFFYVDNHTFGAVVQPALRPDGQVDREAGSTIGFAQDAEIHTRAHAIFGEAYYDVTDQLHLIAGLRYSKEKKWGTGTVVPRFPTTGDVESTSTTPRLSVRYDIADGLNVYATFSKGFKSAVLASFEQSNNFAKPEFLKAYEVGIKATGERYRLSAAAFVYDYTDLQAQFWDGDSAILANADDAKMQGLEFDGLFKVTDALELRLGGAFLTKAEYGQFVGVAYDLPMSPSGMVFLSSVDVTGDRMIKSPKFTGTLALTYNMEVAGGALQASANLYHSTAFHFDLVQRVRQDAYTTVNAQVTYVPAGHDRLQLSVFGRNLTNEAYFTSTLLGPTADAPVYAPPRQIGVGVSYGF